MSAASAGNLHAEDGDADDLELPARGATSQPQLFRYGAGQRTARVSNDFIEYYRLQHICTEQRWAEAVEQFAHPLPLTLKILQASAAGLPKDQSAADVRKALQQAVANAEKSSREELGDSVYEQLGAAVPKMRCLDLDEWIEHGWVEIDAGGKPWHLPTALREFLFVCERAGLLRAQELASALPPYLAASDARFAIDLCAAPGSKTMGLMERLSPEAVVIANDVHAGRAASLRERFQRQGKNSDRVLSCNVDAAAFPWMQVAEVVERGVVPILSSKMQGHEAMGQGDEVPCQHPEDELQAAMHAYRQRLDGGGASAAAGNPWWRCSRLHFDLVLADVPCNGDGTGRKSPSMWAEWKAARALALFPKQLAILRRGLELLAPGAQLIYSTCSLCPVQNEAVVAAAITLHNSKHAQQVHLESVAMSALPAAVRKQLLPGCQSWQVPSPDFSAASPMLYKSWASVPASARSTAGARLRREMFVDFSNENVRQDLPRCARVLPSVAGFQSGGFFLAALRKSATTSMKEKAVYAPRCNNILREARRSVNGLHPEKGAILKFFGLPAEQADADLLGVDRFPLECVALAPGHSKSLVLTTLPAEGLLMVKGLRVVGGGMPLLMHMRAESTFFKDEPPRSVFYWRPTDVAAGLLGRCCSRRLVSLPPALLRKLVEDRRLSAANGDIPAEAFQGCHEWGGVKHSDLVPGGVIVGKQVEGLERPQPPFFSALLSHQTLLLLSSLDERRLHSEILHSI